MIKLNEKILVGCLGAPKTPKNGKIGGFGPPQAHPLKYFFVKFFDRFFLFVVSAFQNRFTFRFHMILRDVMTISKILGFFGQNLGIFGDFYIVKPVPNKCCGN